MTFPFLSGRDSIEVPWPPALPGVTCETHHWMVILLQEVRQARHRLPGTWGQPLGKVPMEPQGWIEPSTFLGNKFDP